MKSFIALFVLFAAIMVQAQAVDSIRVFDAAGNSYYEVDSTAIYQDLVKNYTQKGNSMNRMVTRDFLIAGSAIIVGGGMMLLGMNKKGALDETSLSLMLGGLVIVNTGFGFTISASIKSFKATRHLKWAQTYKERLDQYERYKDKLLLYERYQKDKPIKGQTLNLQIQPLFDPLNRAGGGVIALKF